MLLYFMSAAVLLVLRPLLLRLLLLLAVFPAGPQPPAPDGSVPRWTSTASSGWQRSPPDLNRESKDMPDRTPERIMLKNCRKNVRRYNRKNAKRYAGMNVRRYAGKNAKIMSEIEMSRWGSLEIDRVICSFFGSPEVGRLGS